MATKIYTKTGDKGMTSLLGGTRVPKHHVRIEAYGTIDELNSHIGMLRDIISDQEQQELLTQIQDKLFTMGSHLAADPDKNKMQLPVFGEESVEQLEKAIDRITTQVPEMKSFVLPGGHPQVSQAHITRCVCRRAERCVLRLSETEQVQDIHMRFLNRLSDYLFMLSRLLTQKLGAKEIPWKPQA